MSLADVLSHTSQIRSLLDSLEAIAAAVIPGAAPVVAGIQAVEGTVLNTAAAVAQVVTGAPAAPAAAPAVVPPAPASTPAGAAPSFVVCDLSPALNVLYPPEGQSATLAECEKWADANMTGGFSIRPYPNA